MTHVRLVRFALAPGNEDRVRVLALELVPEIQQQPGCEFVVVFIDDEGQGGVSVLWDSPGSEVGPYVERQPFGLGSVPSGTDDRA